MDSKEKLEKSWKAALTGLSLMTSPGAQAKPPQQAQTHEKFDLDTLHHELKPIAELETSSGKNLAHKPHTGGEFESAYGIVGLKPQTGHETYHKSSHLKKLFPGFDDPAKFTEEIKKNPSFYNAIAANHWNGLKGALGSANKAAYAWRHGRGAAMAARAEQIDSDPYVKKYIELTHKMFGKSEELNKTEKPLEPAKAIELMGSIKDNKEYNFDSLLTANQIMENYSLRVCRMGSNVFASLCWGGLKVGTLSAQLVLDKVLLGDLFIMGTESSIGTGHRGKGLGLALYESMFAYAARLNGINGIVGNVQTAMIPNLFKKLSDKYGMTYTPTYTERPNFCPGLARRVQSALYTNNLVNNFKSNPIDPQKFDSALDELLARNDYV